jgi:hypothetical protein
MHGSNENGVPARRGNPTNQSLHAPELYASVSPNNQPSSEDFVRAAGLGDAALQTHVNSWRGVGAKYGEGSPFHVACEAEARRRWPPAAPQMVATAAPPANDHHALAREYALHGLFVFPVAFPWDAKAQKFDKRPTVDWRAKSTCDLAQIDSWWRDRPEYGVGLDVGKSGLIVFDGDVRDDGVAALGEIVRGQCGAVITTPSGGVHVYYRNAAGDLGNATGDMPKGIDIRGNGGFVVAAGSTLPDGRAWTPFQRDIREFLEVIRPGGTVPELPAALRERLGARKPTAPVGGNGKQKSEIQGKV